MARLIDDLLAQGRIQKPWFVAPKFEEKWLNHVGKLFLFLKEKPPVLLIDNVSEYYFNANDQEVWDLSRDFPNLAPPWELFWTEHKMPKTITSKERGITDSSRLVPNGRQGALWLAAKRAELKGENVPDNLEWCLCAEIFIDYGFGGAIEGGHGTWFLGIDAEGKLIDRPWCQGFHNPMHNEVMKSYVSFLHPALLAISFLHCKNVRIVDNPVPPKLAKRYRERHDGLQPVAHKTLIIEPLKEILRTKGRSGEVGIAKAMHICRGHFATYGSEGRGLLFGKYSGKYWIPSSVRGTKRGAEKPPAREIEVKL